MPGSKRSINIARAIQQEIKKAIIDGSIPTAGGAASAGPPGSPGVPGQDGHSPVVAFGSGPNADVLLVDGVPGPHLTGPAGQMTQGPSTPPAWGTITGAIGDQTDLNGALAGKVGTGDSRLTDARMPTAHGHAESDVMNLATDLAAKMTNPVYAALSAGATAMDFGTNDVVKVTPNASATYTTTVPPAGRVKTLIILTSGTTSRTITFGAGFKATGTLATGTTSARVFVIHFVSDGVNLYESGRTVAMAA